MTRALCLLSWIIAAALATPDALAHEATSVCSSTSTALAAPHPREFLKLNLDLKDVTQTTLQQTFCDEPQNFCQAVRELSPAQRIEAFASAPESRSLLPSGFHRLRVLESDDVQNEVLTSLKESAGAQEPILKQLYTGDAWNRLSGLNQSAIQSLVSHLSNPSLSTPAPVIEKIANLKLLNPFDESIPLETRKGMMAPCGLGEGWEHPQGKTLGEFNAFANVEGYVVVCPKALMATNDEGLLLILLHEISHQIGPCLVGGSLLAQVKTENCEVDASAQPEFTPWLDWMGRTRKLERCFHSAGINAGSDAEWASRILSEEAEREEEKTGKSSCNAKAARQIMPSDRVQEGLLSTCDPSQYKLLIQMLNALDGIEMGEKPLTPKERVHSLARAVQLKLRSTQAKVRSHLPKSNQFNEAIADAFAAQLYERAERLYRLMREKSSPAGAPNDILAGLSGLCATEYDWKLKGEAHSRDDQRMEIFSSQSELRQSIGCVNPIPRGLARNLSRCKGLGL